MRSTSCGLAIWSRFSLRQLSFSAVKKPPVYVRKAPPQISLSLSPVISSTLRSLSPAAAAAASLSFVVVCRWGTMGIVVLFFYKYGLR